MKKYISIFLITIFCFSQNNNNNNNNLPLIYGASFIDRFLSIEVNNLSSNIWGAKNVIPRDIGNGIEDANYSYWGGNIVHDEGKFHLFVARWKENISKGNKSGHVLWWDSEVAHAVSDSPAGPYRVVEVLGKGHNPEIYKLHNGSYVVGVMGNKAYKSKNINGPWEQIITTFKFLNQNQNSTNRTYITKDDGSTLMMNKEGVLFYAEEGNEENFIEIDVPKAYKRKKDTHEEDPVIWKDEVQYNLIVNDATNRKAYHLTSLDGLHNWKYEEGYAFDPSIMKHKGGTQEAWYKFERPKVLLDKYGRVTHMNFAVIDTVKNSDLANDNHSSKNIVIPMIVQKRLKLLDTVKSTESIREIKMKIMAEDGFDPHKDIDYKSLRFGSSYDVNRGLGANLKSFKKEKDDLILFFEGKITEIEKQGAVAKLLGKTKKGEVLFGYVKVL